MTAKMAEAINSGKKYAAFVRAVLSDGRVIVKPSETTFTRYADGAVMRASAFISPAELNGATVVRTGLACESDGEEITGNSCPSETGALGVTASCTVRADIAGTVGDKLARILTGVESLCEMIIRAECKDGTSAECECETEITENGFVLRASVPASARVLTVVAGGEDSLVLNAPVQTERFAFQATNTSMNAEFWTELDIASMASVATDGSAVDFIYKNLPLRISSVAEKLPECFNGRLSAFGKYLAVRAADSLRVFRGDEPVVERAAHDVVSEWVSEDGMLAYSENGKVRLCKGMTDLFIKEVNADYVVITGTGSNAVVHCLDVNGGVCVGLDVGGTQVYSRASNDLAIGLSDGKVMAVEQERMALYSPAGIQTFARDLFFIVRKVYRSMPDILLVEAGPESVSTKMIVSLRATYVLDENGEVTDACDRLFCVRDGGGYELRVFKEFQAQTVAEVGGGELAYTDALYVRGEQGTFRYRPLECATMTYSLGIEINDALTCEADRYVVGSGEKQISVNINVEEN